MLTGGKNSQAEKWKMNKVMRSVHNREEITGEQILSGSIIKLRMPKSKKHNNKQ
jgi:hypothetical protein